MSPEGAKCVARVFRPVFENLNIFPAPNGAAVIPLEASVAGTFTNLLYHVIFSTKNRESIIYDSFKERLYKYIGGIIRSKGGKLLSIGGTADHIHLAMKLKPVESISKVVGELKGNSSKWVNDSRFLVGHFSWQGGFGAFSVSESQLNSVKLYIESQEKHHSTLSFKDEFVSILDKHNISYDLNYIWD